MDTNANMNHINENTDLDDLDIKNPQDFIRREFEKQTAQERDYREHNINPHLNKKYIERGRRNFAADGQNSNNPKSMQEGTGKH